MTAGDKNEEGRCRSCGRWFGRDDRFCADCGAVRPVASHGVSAAVGASTVEASTVKAPAAVQPPMQRPATNPNPRPSRRLIGGVVATILAIAGVGVGIALATSGGSKHTTRQASPPVAETGALTSSTTSPAEQQAVEPSTTTAQTTPTAAGTQAPLPALETYWTDIRAHDFASAYGYLVPGAIGMTESQFVAGEQSAGITSVSFHGKITSDSGSAATVAIQSLITHDAQYGCRRWTGTYEMTIEGGSWLIARAKLSPRSC